MVKRDAWGRASSPRLGVGRRAARAYSLAEWKACLLLAKSRILCYTLTESPDLDPRLAGRPERSGGKRPSGFRVRHEMGKIFLFESAVTHWKVTIRKNKR